MSAVNIRNVFDKVVVSGDGMAVAVVLANENSILQQLFLHRRFFDAP